MAQINSFDFPSKTSDFNEFFSVTLKVQANTDTLFQIIVKQGIICSCSVQSVNARRFSSNIFHHEEGEAMVSNAEIEEVSLNPLPVPLVLSPEEILDGHLPDNVIHSNHDKLLQLDKIESFSRVIREVQDNLQEEKDINREAEDISPEMVLENQSFPSCQLNETDVVSQRKILMQENQMPDKLLQEKLDICTQVTSAEVSTKPNVRRKSKKELKLVLKAAQNSGYSRKSKKNSKYKHVKSGLKKVALTSAKKLKDKGEIDKELSTQTNTAVFFSKTSGVHGQEEHCLLCGELFYSTNQSEAEFHLLNKHKREYEILHEHMFTFENYLEERAKRVERHRLNKMNENSDILCELKYEETECGKMAGEDTECDEYEMDFNSLENKRLRKTKKSFLYTCLICNNGKYVTVQNLKHIKNFHNGDTDFLYDVPEVRKCNYLVGTSLYQYINENKIDFDLESAIFSCKICGIKLDTRRSAIRHARYSHRVSDEKVHLTCNLCSTTFCEEKLLVQHMVDEHNSMRTKWFACVSCDQRFEAKYELRDHEAEVHNDAFTCPFDGCKAKFYQTIKSFNLHIINHLSNIPPNDVDEILGDETIMNNIVDNVFSDNIDIDSTLINNATATSKKVERKWANELCSVCGEIFASNSINGSRYGVKYKLMKHIETKHQDHIADVDSVNVFECSSCDLKFLSIASRNEHAKDEHFDATCPYSDCQKVFKKRGTLNSHIRRTHAKAGTAQCQICGKELCDKLQLQLHIDAVHEKKRDFACHFAGCGKCFSRKSNLTVHLRIHTGEKPLKCTYCNFRGRQRNNITSHMKARHQDIFAEKVNPM